MKGSRIKKPVGLPPPVEEVLFEECWQRCSQVGCNLSV